MKSLVLVVDDDEMIVEGLTSLLHAENIGCDGTLDRPSAEAMMRDTFYPVIVADIRLQTEEEGFLLLDEIHRLSPGSRVISMTGYATPELEAAARQHGSCLVLQKPMASAEILSAVNDLLAEIERLAAAQTDLNLETLYAGVRKLMYSIPIRQYRLTADEAEDVVQEAWLLFLERRGLIHNNTSWLAGTVRNLSRRQIDRARRTREKFCSTDTIADVATTTSASPDDNVALQAALKTLDPASRTLCTLIAIEGYSYDEVRLATGLPLGSIGPMYLRAKKKMQSAAGAQIARSGSVTEH
jgi:RNA polymerase sigma factor (sigma-70 family)